MRNLWLVLTVCTTLLALSIGWLVGAKYGLPSWSSNSALINFIEKPKPKELPFNKYSIVNLHDYPFQASQLTIESTITTNPAFTSYVFSFKTMGKKMTGQ